jgi:hypothetical protein
LALLIKCYSGVLESRSRNWAGHVTGMGERRVAYRVLVGKPERKTLGRPKNKWEDNIEMYL